MRRIGFVACGYGWLAGRARIRSGAGVQTLVLAGVRVRVTVAAVQGSDDEHGHQDEQRQP